jgi:hypothetical protein
VYKRQGSRRLLGPTPPLIVQQEHVAKIHPANVVRRSRMSSEDQLLRYFGRGERIGVLVPFRRLGKTA